MMPRRKKLWPGEPIKTIVTPKTIARFMEKVVFDVDGPTTRGQHCWLWIAHCDENGYGHFRLGRRVGAHRASYHIFRCRGLRHGQDVDHKCDRHNCVNPAHLCATSRAINSSRGGKRRHAISHHSKYAKNNSYDSVRAKAIAAAKEGEAKDGNVWSGETLPTVVDPHFGNTADGDSDKIEDFDKWLLRQPVQSHKAEE